MTKPTKGRRPKKRRPAFSVTDRILLLILGLAGLCVAGLVFFARMEEAPGPAEVAQTVEAPVADSRQLYAEVEAFLAKFSQDADGIHRDLDHEPVRYTVTGELPAPDQTAALQARLRQIAGDYAVQLRPASSLVVAKARRALIVIDFLPPPAAIPAGPLLAIIMDDLGRSTATARTLLAMPQQVTFAILPDEPQALRVAEMAHAAGREVMLHAPMEPQGYPGVNPGRDALLIAHSAAEIRRNFDLLLARVPHVAGINNHMGSRFTEEAGALAPVMESLREKGLYFIDSLTTNRSRVTEVARRYGVPTLRRDLFLDNVAEVEAIAVEVRRLEARARSQGLAVGICHPYPETLEALRRELPGLQARGITFVPVSVLLRKQSQAAGS